MSTALRVVPDRVRAGIYLRISADPNDTRKGVVRQEADCREIADDLDWDVVGVFDENNTSATRAKSRPEYQKLIAAVRRGEITGLLFWEFDRFTRSVREADDLLDLARDHGVRAASTSGGEMDLISPIGRRNVVVAGADARKETDQLAKRLKRAFDQKARAGQPHGAVPYGWRREREFDPRTGAVVSSRDVLEPEQAQVIRDAVAMLRSGTSLRSVAKALNDRGSLPPRLSHKDANGERHQIKWSSQQVRQVLLRARNAGLRQHRDVILEGVTGEWPPIFDRDTYDWLVGTLTDPDRVTNRGKTRRYLLSGLLTCGICGSTDMLAMSGKLRNGKRQAAGYGCRGCHRLRRQQPAVDATVEDYMIQLCADPATQERIEAGDPAVIEEAKQAKAAAEARIRTAEERVFSGQWPATALDRAYAVNQPVIEEQQAVIDANRKPDLPYRVFGPNAETEWRAASLDERRALIAALVRITIMPTAGSGYRFDPELIVIEPAG